MPDEIRKWLENLSSEERISELLDHESPEGSDMYDLGYRDASTILAHRILAVLTRIEKEAANA